MSNKYKLIAVDLDDSLLNDQWGIGDADRNAIARAIEAGIKVVIATGRMYCSALPYARELKLQTPLITYQGAYVRFPDSEKVLYDCPLPYDVTLELLSKIVPLGYHINIYVDDQLLVEKMTEEARLYQKIAGIEPIVVGDLENYLVHEKKCGSTKLVVVVAQEKKVDLLAKELHSEFLGRVNITKSKPYFLELMNIKVDKGQALAAVAEYYGIARESTIALGDSYNDLEMLEYAGVGAVVANAREEIKARADYITSANTQGGVAQVINKFIFNEVD